MRIIEEVSDVKTMEKGAVLTIGNFDGVHIGHQEILSAAKKAATERQTQLMAMTFDPHPVAVLKPECAPGVLTPLYLKSHYLKRTGIDCLVVLESTPAILALSGEEFVNRFLVEGVRPGVVVEGHDFNFGRGRTGNIDKLQCLGVEKGFEVCVVEAENIKLSTGQTHRVSSTMIRELLEAGAVTDAALALGKPYRLIGRVIPGHGKGKQLGFPTANLQCTEQIVPAHGVYAGRVEIGDTAVQVCQTRDRIPAALSIGHAPTVASDRPQLIEAHLLAESVPDLVGKFLAMDFIERIRQQQKFDSERQLSAQIASDCKKAAQILEMA